MLTSINSIKSNKLVISAAMALVVTVTAISSPAQAGRKERWIAGGVVAGVVGSAIVGHAIRQNRYHSRPRLSRWERHVRRCHRAYRSYDESTDTYIGYDGYERRCRK